MGDFDQILPVTVVKKRLLELLKQLQELNGAIAITKNGLPAGVLMSMDDYESLIETIEHVKNIDEETLHWGRVLLIGAGSAVVIIGTIVGVGLATWKDRDP